MNASSSVLEAEQVLDGEWDALAATIEDGADREIRNDTGGEGGNSYT
jgi:hypothetical protein